MCPCKYLTNRSVPTPSGYHNRKGTMASFIIFLFLSFPVYRGNKIFFFVQTLLPSFFPPASQTDKHTKARKAHSRRSRTKREGGRSWDLLCPSSSRGVRAQAAASWVLLHTELPLSVCRSSRCFFFPLS